MGYVIGLVIVAAASFLMGCIYKEKVLAAKQRAADEIKAIANKL